MGLPQPKPSSGTAEVIDGKVSPVNDPKPDQDISGVVVPLFSHVKIPDTVKYAAQPREAYDFADGNYGNNLRPHEIRYFGNPGHYWTMDQLFNI